MGSAAQPGSWRILVQPSKTVGKERTEAEGLSDNAAVTVTYSLLQIPLDSPLLYEDEIRSLAEIGDGGLAGWRAFGFARRAKGGPPKEPPDALTKPSNAPRRR